MNQRSSRLIGIALLVVVALISPGCSGQLTVVPPLPGQETATVASGEDGIHASGFIEAQEVSVVAETGGRVAQVLVDEADTVTAGQIVVKLDDTLLQSARQQAEAAVTVAEANLADLIAEPTEEEIAAAQATLDMAQAELEGAQRASRQAWAAVSNPREIDVQIAAAQLDVDTAAQQVAQIQGAIREVEYEALQVEESGVDDPTRRDYLALSRENLVAQLAAAQAAYDGAVKKLQLLQAQRQRPLALIAQAHQAQAQIAIAEGQVQLAQAQYDLLVAGPLPEEIAIAQAQVDLAKAQLAQVDTQIARLSLAAPIDGVVTTRAIAAGETASPGVPLLTIADLTELKLVVYIPETDLGQVRLGAQVDIEVDSYPGETFSGQVALIAREAEFTPRNVQTEEERVNLVFAVEISIDNADGRLKPGMPADVLIRVP